MRLKIVTANTTRVVSIGDDSVLSELLDLIVKEGITNSVDLQIKAGFPPKPISLEPNAKLLDLGIRPGDRLVLEVAGGSGGGVGGGVIQGQSTENREASSSSGNPVPDSTPFSNSDIPFVKVADGFCVLRKVPDDNSCLFRSVSYAVFNNLEEGSRLRSIVADSIRNDNTGKYNSAILGKPVADYVSWITKTTSWGGAIELDVLSRYLELTINSIDVETGRIDAFNPGKLNYILILYSGIHYDATAFTPLNSLDDQSLDIGVLDSTTLLGKQYVQAAKQLSQDLNRNGYVTNTATFKVKCKVCNKVLVGEKKVSEHAAQTSHYDFGEV